MILITVFSYYKNYTTGIDRPFVCGTASEKAKRLSEIELKGLEKCISIMEPGLPVKDMYAPVYYDFIIPELNKAGFENFKVQGYMGHATGLSLAEPPMLHPRDETILQPGMVVHVEPGIYLTGQSMGLRTAEMVEITEKGINILTKDMPRRSGSLA
jgi:Xaa-Pro aminopeptidase